MPLNEMRILLLVILALPFVAGIVVAALGARNRNAVRWIALGAVLVNLALTGFVIYRAVPTLQKPVADQSTFRPEFVPGDPGKETRGGPVASHSTAWNLMLVGTNGQDGKPAVVQFYIGLDGLNIWLIALTSFLLLPSVLVSWESIKERANEFYAWLLVLQGGLIGVFLAFDIVLFYVFFELTLVPLFFLIGIWGGPA